jgi:hypothetical protein
MSSKDYLLQQITLPGTGTQKQGHKKFRASNVLLPEKKFVVRSTLMYKFPFYIHFNVYKHGVLGSGIYENLKKA